MKDDLNENTGPWRQPADGDASQRASNRVTNAIPSADGGSQGGVGVDLWTVLDLILHRWHWLILGACICGTVFFLLGWQFLKPKYTATGELVRYEAIGESEYFKGQPMSSETFAGLMLSPDILRKVGSQAVPPIPPETLIKCIKVDPAPDSDMIKVMLMSRDPQQAVRLLNLYLQETLNYMRDWKRRQMAQIADNYLKEQVGELDRDIKQVQKEFVKLPGAAALTNQIARVGGKETGTNLDATNPGQLMPRAFARQAERVQNAISELNDLLVKYTDLHPAVQAKRAQIKELEAQLQKAGGTTNLPLAAMTAPLAGALAGEAPGGFSPELDVIHIKLRALEDGRLELLKRQREAELYAANPPETVKVLAPADLKTTKGNMRRVKLGIVTIFGSCLGVGASLLLVFLVEFVDSRLKTEQDVERVTQLPVLATLGNVEKMSAHDRAQWGFRAWTMLQGRLSPSANHGLVCGITSSGPGEGRTTWIKLLAEAAGHTGFRVLTIATRPSPTHHQLAEASAESPKSPPSEASAPRPGDGAGNGNKGALTTSVLASPAQVTEQLTGPNSQPMVHIPLPGWVWNLERRKQWREALNQWRRIENLVILVELPPASVPEAVLLGANLPNMLWLTKSGVAQAAATRSQLETLRHARCNLVGAVLNHLPGISVRKRFPRWLSCLAALLALGVAAQAQQSTTNLTATGVAPDNQTETRPTGSFGITRPSQRAEWQKRLTLGPGDVLTLGLYGTPELTRVEVPIGPDGRISYLEAQDVLATGLTIDDLRGKLDQELGKYRRAPHTMIAPVAFKSKKYYMLGKVATKGVYSLDRPLTIVQALARAHGLESALVDRNVVDLADFDHSFVARGGKRIPINLARLFSEGDLSQNIAVEPDDYIYFAPQEVQQVYVLGEVRLPGTVVYNPDLTIIAAISGRGGFTERAWRARVLVVRGSLDSPETAAVDTHAITDGKALNFKLRPKDIIYVSSRPFIRVEEAADLAATAFIQSIITSWVGVDVVKPFRNE